MSCIWTYLKHQETVLPGSNPHRRGQVYRLAHETPLFRGVGHFWNCRTRLRYCPVPFTHVKKGLVSHSSGWWDGRQIPLVAKVLRFCTIVSIRLMGFISAGHDINGTDLVGCVMSLVMVVSWGCLVQVSGRVNIRITRLDWLIPRASRGRPRRLNPSSEGLGFLRGIPTRPETF